MKLRSAIGWSLLGLVVLCGADAKVPEASRKLKAHLGAKVADILKAPTKVEVFRLDPRYLGSDKSDAKQFLGYRITATGKEQGTEFGARLAGLLQQDKAWFNRDKFTAPNPVVGFRIWKNKDAVEILYDSSARVGARMVGAKSKVINGNCDPLAAGFGKLAVECFPNDKDLKQAVEMPGLIPGQ